MKPELPSARTDEPASAHTDEAFPPHLRILKPVGRGGTAVVYEATHTRLQTRVAVKVLHVAPNCRHEGRKRLLREAKLCANLRDARLPRVFDVQTLPDGTPYLVMELIRGETLDTTLSRGALCYEDAVWLLSELLDILSVLHAAAVVHRDIKPENLMLQVDERGIRQLRLIDFGISKVLYDDFASAHLTQTGALLGTPQYIAPEVLVGCPPDERVDLYAATVTFYELLSGTAPFNVDSFGESIAASLRDHPAPLAEHCALTTAELDAFVQRGLARDPELRFQSAFEMRKALLELPNLPRATSLSGLATARTRAPASLPPRTSLAKPSHIAPRRAVRRWAARPVLCGLAGFAVGAAWHLPRTALDTPRLEAVADQRSQDAAAEPAVSDSLQGATVHGKDVPKTAAVAPLPQRTTVDDSRPAIDPSPEKHQLKVETVEATTQPDVASAQGQVSPQSEPEPPTSGSTADEPRAATATSTAPKSTRDAKDNETVLPDDTRVLPLSQGRDVTNYAQQLEAVLRDEGDSSRPSGSALVDSNARPAPQGLPHNPYQR